MNKQTEALKRILHLIPFVHFYHAWKMCDKEYGYSERQYTFCEICNKKKHRIVNNV